MFGGIYTIRKPLKPYVKHLIYAIAIIILFVVISKIRGRSLEFSSDCDASYGPIDPEDYRATALINKGKHLLNANIVQKLDAILALKVIGDDCGTVTWICDAKHGEGSVKMLTSKSDQDIDLNKIDFRLIARDNLLYDLYKGKKSVEMEYLYVGTTYVKQSLILDRFPLFLLQGNIQINGPPLTHSLYFKLVNIVNEVDFFKDTKLQIY